MKPPEGAPAAKAPEGGEAPKSALAAALEAPQPPKAVELKLPDGFKADEKALGAFKGLAGELGLDSAKAQKVFDSFVAHESARAKADEDAFSAQDKKWASEWQADKDVGGERMKESLQHIRRALEKFGGRDMAALLERAGLANHPLLVKGFVAIGRALAEDSVAGASTPAGANGRLPLHEVLFPTPSQSHKE